MTGRSSSPHAAAILPAGAVEPVKGHLVDERVGDEVLAHLAAGRDDAEHALGQPGLLHDLGEHQVSSGVSGAFQHDGDPATTAERPS
ncbi:MAG: hypothetical protein R2702_01695 [Acidimicrobiales bacterium]